MSTRDKKHSKQKTIPIPTLDEAPFISRAGHAEPWKYGPYRVVVQRRVTEEEQISLECYEPNFDCARATYEATMDSMNAQRLAYNQRVWAVNERQMERLSRMIELRGENVRQLDSLIREKREWLLAKGVDISDIPLFEDDDPPTNGA